MLAIDEQEAERRSLVLRFLTRRVGALPPAIHPQVEALSPERLEALGEALLDVESLTDLEAWLAASLVE
jgi:Domain of unknown function (DUF4351)